MDGHSKILFASDKERLKEIKDYIDANLQLDLHVKTISARFNMGSSTMRRHFLQFYTLPIHRYIFLERMKKAMQLLTDQTLHIREIALAVGYNECSAFTHAFKKHFGNSPAHYLKDERFNGK